MGFADDRLPDVSFVDAKTDAERAQDYYNSDAYHWSIEIMKAGHIKNLGRIAEIGLHAMSLQHTSDSPTVVAQMETVWQFAHVRMLLLDEFSAEFSDMPGQQGEIDV